MGSCAAPSAKGDDKFITTDYLQQCPVDALKRKGMKINAQLLSHLSPLGWEHINLTGDYIWKNNRIPTSGKFRRLRAVKIDKVKKQP